MYLKVDISSGRCEYRIFNVILNSDIITIMKIYLVRHGIKEKTTGDPPLSSEGRIQAVNTGKHLKNLQIDKVLSSPLLRTKQTADLICKEIGLKYKIDNRLRERMNWGDKSGQPFQEFLEEWTRSTVERDFIPSVGDSSRKAGLRLESVINDEDSTINIVLVTHGGIITDFLRNVFTEDELNNVCDKFAENMDSMIRECSVTIVDYEFDKFFVKSLAIVDHLTIENVL